MRDQSRLLHRLLVPPGPLRPTVVRHSPPLRRKRAACSRLDGSVSSPLPTQYSHPQYRVASTHRDVLLVRYCPFCSSFQRRSLSPSTLISGRWLVRRLPPDPSPLHFTRKRSGSRLTIYNAQQEGLALLGRPGLLVLCRGDRLPLLRLCVAKGPQDVKDWEELTRVESAAWAFRLPLYSRLAWTRRARPRRAGHVPAPDRRFREGCLG